MKSFTKPVAVFIGLAVAISAIAMPTKQAHAQSLAELNPLLEELQQELQELQTMLPIAAKVSAGCRGEFTRNLGVGSHGPQVHQLQHFLNTMPATQVAQTGPGSPGQVTSYYGPHTETAVASFQSAYSPQILVPLGLQEPTGFWGPSSRDQANAICTQRMA